MMAVAAAVSIINVNRARIDRHKRFHTMFKPRFHRSKTKPNFLNKTRMPGNSSSSVYSRSALSGSIEVSLARSNCKAKVSQTHRVRARSVPPLRNSALKRRILDLNFRACKGDRQRMCFRGLGLSAGGGGRAHFFARFRDGETTEKNVKHSDTTAIRSGMKHDEALPRYHPSLLVAGGMTLLHIVGGAPCAIIIRFPFDSILKQACNFRTNPGSPSSLKLPETFREESLELFPSACVSVPEIWSKVLL